MKDVIGFEYETLHELKLIQQNITLDNFHELATYFILVYDGVVVGFLLHNFVPLNEVIEYAITMVHLFEQDGHMKKACSLEMAMAMFNTRFPTKILISMGSKPTKKIIHSFSIMIYIMHISFLFLRM